MNNFTSNSAISPTVSTKDTVTTASHRERQRNAMPSDACRAESNTITKRIALFFYRLIKFFSHKSASLSTPMPASTPACVVTQLAQVQKPIVFKNTASTLISSIGTYAGKEVALDVRKRAEEQFHKMLPAKDTIFN